MTSREVRLSVFGLTSMLMLIGCQTAPRSAEKRDAAADAAAINALRDQFTAAYNSHDAAATAATYTDDAILLAENEAAAEGRQAIQACYAAMFQGSAVKLVLTPLETQVAGDWAYDRGNATITVTPKSGKPIEESSRYLVIVKRQPDGSWKIYRDMENSGNPPPNAAGKKK